MSSCCWYPFPVIFAPWRVCMESLLVNWGSSPTLMKKSTRCGTQSVSRLTPLPYQTYENTGVWPADDWVRDYVPARHEPADHPLLPELAAIPGPEDVSRHLNPMSDPMDGSVGSEAASPLTPVSHAPIPPPPDSATNSRNDQRLLRLNNTLGSANISPASVHRYSVHSHAFAPAPVRGEHSVQGTHEYYYTLHPVPITKDPSQESLITPSAISLMHDYSSQEQNYFDVRERKSQHRTSRPRQGEDFFPNRSELSAGNRVAASVPRGAVTHAYNYRDPTPSQAIGQRHSPSHDFHHKMSHKSPDCFDSDCTSHSKSLEPLSSMSGITSVKQRSSNLKPKYKTAPSATYRVRPTRLYPWTQTFLS